MIAVHALAEKIDEEWGRSGHSLASFPAIAARHISGPLDIALLDVVDSILGATELPAQRCVDQSFGQPGVTLLIHGRSVHCRYRFNAQDGLDGVTVGQLSRQDLTLLHPGEATEIPIGAALIHSAFHVDSPSLTLVARTHQDDTPELTYLPPGIAYDTRARSETLHKRLQLLDTLAMTGDPQYARAAARMLEQGSLYDALACLLRLGGHDAPSSVFDAALQQVHTRFEAFSGNRALLAGAREERRRCRLIAQRAAMTTSQDRTFLALLLGCDQAEDILATAQTHTGSRETAVEMIATGAARLLGGDETRQLLVRAAVTSELEFGGVGNFLRIVEALLDAPVSADRRPALEQFRASVLSHPLLVPLFNSKQAGSLPK